MAKIRTLKGEFFRNADISRGGPWAKMLAAGLICAVADDDGRGKAGGEYLKGEIFTHDQVTPDEIALALQFLEREQFIRLYFDHAKPFFAVLNWKKHQPVPPSRYKPSDLPAPPNTKPRKHSPTGRRQPPTERKHPSTAVSSRAGVGSDRSGIGIGEHGDVVGGGASANGLSFEQAAENLIVPVDPDVTVLCEWLLNKRGWETFGSLDTAKHERSIAAAILDLGISCTDAITKLEVMWAETDPDDRPSSLGYFWTRLQDEQHNALKQSGSHAPTEGLTKLAPQLKAGKR